MAKFDGFGEIRRNFEKIKVRHVAGMLTTTCTELIRDAVASKGYRGFTGNTQTSYSCGIYINGKLQYIVSAGDRMRGPVAKKVKKGKRMFLALPYEGERRSVIGEVTIDNLYGQQTAEKFLKSFKGTPKKGFAIVMTTGTEYSVYLEKVMDLTVLGTTYLRAKNILFNNVKPVD